MVAAKVGQYQLFQSIVLSLLLPSHRCLFYSLPGRPLKRQTGQHSQQSLPGKRYYIRVKVHLVMVFAVMSVPSIYTHKTSSMWLFLTYGVFTVSEICFKPNRFYHLYQACPQRLTALMMGGWFISTSLGGKIASVMASSWDNIHDKKIFFGIVLPVAAFIGGILIFIRVKSLDKIVKTKRVQPYKHIHPFTKGGPFSRL